MEAFANIYADFAQGLAGGSEAQAITENFSANVAVQGIAMMESIART